MRLETGRVSGFLHQWNWLPRFNWNIVESGIKHHNSYSRFHYQNHVNSIIMFAKWFKTPINQSKYNLCIFKVHYNIYQGCVQLAFWWKKKYKLIKWIKKGSNVTAHNQHILHGDYKILNTKWFVLNWHWPKSPWTEWSSFS
jgi:hypothetical protein